MDELVRKVLANERFQTPSDASSRRACDGGARPKALLEIDGEPWAVKFADGEPVDTALVEHATMTLARPPGGMRTAETKAIPVVTGHEEQIDRPLLRDQRRSFLASSPGRG